MAGSGKVADVVLKDDLYCHEPFCRSLQSLGLDLILVCNPESHPTFYERLAHLERNKRHRHLLVHALDRQVPQDRHLPLYGGAAARRRRCPGGQLGRTRYHRRKRQDAVPQRLATNLAVDRGNAAQITEVGAAVGKSRTRTITITF